MSNSTKILDPVNSTGTLPSASPKEMGVWDEMWLIEAEATRHPVGLSASVTSQLPFSLPKVREEGERTYNHKDFSKN